MRSWAKARHTLAKKLNSTRSTLLKVDSCRNRRQIGNKVDCRRMRSTLLPVLATNRQQFDSTACRGRLCRQLGRLCRPNVERPFDFVAMRTKATRSTLSKVDFQQSRPCSIQLCRQCVPGFIQLACPVGVFRY